MIGQFERLTGMDAIRHVCNHGGQLNKYADWYEGALENVAPSYAMEIAVEDPSLIWCDVKREVRA